MKSQVISSVNALDPEAWDRLAHPSFYLSSDWLRARSRTIKAAERFVLVSDEEDSPLVGVPGYLADGSAHPGFDPARVLTFSDLTDPDAEPVSGAVEALAQLRAALRERAGDWLPSLVVGTPARYGGISYAPGLAGDGARAALGTAIDAVERQATADAARSICWFYFAEDEDPLLDVMLRERGYLSFVVDAECYLPIVWQDFGGYLSSFKAEGRRKIRYEMAAFDAAGVKVELHGGEALGSDLAALERQWRLKYGRTPPLTEIVADYEELRSYLSSSLRVFVATLAGRPIGFTVFLEQGDTWYSRFGGFDYSVGNLFLYYNLLFYRPIQVFVERKARYARYALKSYQAKRSRGCLLRNVLAYVRPPEGWSTLGASLEIIDRAQRLRFAAIANRRIARNPT